VEEYHQYVNNLSNRTYSWDRMIHTTLNKTKLKDPHANRDKNIMDC
jgi:hypothetical protein